MSTIAVAKASQGFTPANQRPSCRDCAHGRVDAGGAQWRPTHNGNVSWRCVLGGFMVNGMDTCGKHVAAGNYRRASTVRQGV